MKQRLIGTVVLGCLALILIPLLLDGDGIEPRPLTLEIPPEPQIPPVQMPLPERPQVVEDTLREQPEPDPVELGALPEFSETLIGESVADAEPPTDSPAPSTVTEPAADRLPALDAQGIPEGWVVRLGIFGERRNRDALLATLLQAGYKAYPEQVSNTQGVFTGIFVGPVLTRAEANSLMAELKNSFKLEPLVQRFSLNEQR